MPASNNGVHVHGLTPGQEYVFTVVTTLGANSFYSKTTVYTNFTVVTIPAPPGEIIESISSLTSSSHVLRFHPSEGRVAGYRLTLGDTLYEVLIPEVTVANLSADTHYNYTITAYNKRGDASHVTSGCFKTGPAGTLIDFPIEQSGETTKAPLIAGVTTGSIIVIAGAIVVIVIFVRRRNPHRTGKTDTNITKTCDDHISMTGTSTKSTHPGGRTMNEYRTMNNENLSMTGTTIKSTHPGGRTMKNDAPCSGDNQAESDYDCIRDSVMASWKEGTYVNTKEIENAHRRDQQQEDDVYENVGFNQN
ncbi:unnamed protein product [Lymnaea stagnalis]|uniref:Fibronectin type-III domain-containing protein n=1 Tax=Lymnaea stagnalis TaxID=6523 RepID=A0AAV2IMS2_LYMST